MDPNPSEASRGGEGPRREELLARYVDRLNAGEAVDAGQIRRDHPDCADELVELLKGFEGFGRSGDDVGLADVFGDYRIVREIGRGGMGVVYEALDPSMDRRVALKVLSAGLMVDGKSVERFRREARAVGKLSHPNIVAIYATGVQRDTPYIAMEFVEGESLEKVLERKRPESSPRSGQASSSELTRSVRDGSHDVTQALPPPAPGTAASPEDESWSPIPSSPDDLDLSYCIRMAGIFAEAAEALGHAHSRGIVHRDLKPSNLILTPDHRLRILDFGLARVEGQEHLTASGEILGTPRYMSPEQVRALAAIDHRTDIYSLGATLYEVLTLRPPIGGRNAQDTLSQIVHRDPPSPRRFNARIPRDLETIVLKCLRKEPRDRYQTAAELLEDLRRFKRGDPILARPLSLGERVVRTVRRNAVKLAAAAAFSAVLATAVYLGIQSSRHAGNLLVTRYEDVVKNSVSQLLTGGALAEHVGGFAWNQSGMDPDRLGAGIEFESELIARAEAALREVIAEIPERPDGYFHLARCLFARGNVSEAATQLEPAVERGFVPAMVLHARILDTQGEAARARELRERARSAEGADWVDSWIEGRQALDTKRWKDAAASFGELIELLRAGREPYLGSAVEIYLLCGLAHLQSENYREARGCFTAASALQQSAEPEIFLGFTDYAQGSPGEAEATFETVAARYADNRAVQTEIIGLIASIYWARFQDIPRAMNWAERMAPGYEREIWRASCLGVLGRTDEALEAADELVRLKPEVGISYYLAAVANMMAGRLQEAEALAKKACALVPTSSAPYSVLAWSLAMQERYIEAFLFLRKAVQVEPEAAAPHYFLGKSYLAQSDFVNAQEHIEKAIESSHGGSGSFFELADAHHALAMTLEALNKPEEALEHFRTAARAARDANFSFDLDWIRDLAVRELVAGRRREALNLLESGLEHRWLSTNARASLEREVAQHARALRPALPSLRAVDLALADLDRDELVGVASTWRFRRGRDAPSPGGEWTEPGFDDADWESGPGPFGYGRGRFATVLGDMKDGYTSVYLRAAFARPPVTAPGASRLVLTVTADDGFVAYLNGSEVARARVPADAGYLPHSARARVRVASAAPALELEIDRGVLVEGRNVLAIQGLNVDLASSDFRLAARLTLEWRPDAERRLARTREYLDSFRKEAQSESMIAVRQYLEGRLFEIDGETERAASLFSESLERLPAHPIPSLALYQSYRARGESEKGVEILRECAAANCPSSLSVLAALTAASLVDLHRRPAELETSMPCRGQQVAPFDYYSRMPRNPASELEWLLRELGAGRPLRINCGGNDFEGASGETWSGDRLYETGQAVRAADEDLAIAGTDRAGLYLRARRFSRTVFTAPGYLIPLPAGRYRVSLHFAEIHLSEPGRRRFDVRLDDEVVLEDYDPASTGIATAEVKHFEVDVEDGLLDIVFGHRLGDPLISAIEISPLEG